MPFADAAFPAATAGDMVLAERTTVQQQEGIFFLS